MDIGKVLKPQGIKGEIKALLNIDFEKAEQLKSFKIGGEEYSVVACAIRGGIAYLTLANINSRDQAQQLCGKIIEIERENAPKIGDDEYYVDDIIGLSLIDLSGNSLGEIIGVESFGAADVFVVKSKDAILRFPFIQRLNLSFDFEKCVATIDGERLKEVCVYEGNLCE